MIVPAVLAKTKQGLYSKLKRVPSQAKAIQIDIMDGSFVKNKTISPRVIPKTKQKQEYHLMVKDPLSYIEEINHAECIIVHYESCKKNLSEVFCAIKAKKAKIGLAIKPRTKISEIKPLLKKIDVLLIMTIYPGAMGKKFMPSMLKKITQAQKSIGQLTTPRPILEVDGGINEETIRVVQKAGARRFVVGSAIMRKRDTKKAYSRVERFIK